MSSYAADAYVEGAASRGVAAALTAVEGAASRGVAAALTARAAAWAPDAVAGASWAAWVAWAATAYDAELAWQADLLAQMAGEP